MKLSKKEWRKQFKIGKKRQLQGKYPIGWFPPLGTVAPRRAGGKSVRAKQKK